MRSIPEFLFVSCLVLAAGCAAVSDVTPIGPDAFMATAHSNDVNARVDGQQAKVAQSAADFCAHRGGHVEVIRVQADAPPPGRPPSAELDFRCRPG
jgi:putative hemolysin